MEIIVKDNDKSIVKDGDILVYQENNKPLHKGIVEIKGSYYYASKNGELICNKYHVVHRTMTNHLVKHGTYKFDENGILDIGSYIPPKIIKKHSSKKKKNFIKKNKKAFVIIAAAVVLLVITTIVCSFFVDFHNNSAIEESVNHSVILQEFKDPVYLCSSSMQAYYEGKLDFSDLIENDISPYRGLEFNYSLPSDGMLKIDSREFNLESSKKSVMIDNLKTGTTYNYTVSSGDENYSGSVTIQNTNRFINMPGAYNTRDIGGYKGLDNKTVKQGMIIRGTEIDGLVEKDYHLEESADIDVFNIKYDFDLRNPSIYSGEYVSPFGKEVEHKFYASPMYAECFQENNYGTMRAIFIDLADEDNYPMYMHCTYGSDRTGSIMFLLQGLLGVSYSDMSFEYRLSTLFIHSLPVTTNLAALQSGINEQQGDTVAEKVESFLIDKVGLEQSDVDSIRNILLE